MQRLSSSKKVAGVKQTRVAVVENRARVVFLAYDAPDTMTEPIERLCREKGVEVINCHTRKEIAKACKLDVLCAAAAVIE